MSVSAKKARVYAAATSSPTSSWSASRASLAGLGQLELVREAAGFAGSLAEVGEQADPGERLRRRGRLRVIAGSKTRFRPPARHPTAAAEPPRQEERSDEPEPAVGITRDGVGQRSLQVVVFGVEAREPFELVGSADSRLDGIGECDAPVAVGEPRRVVLARLAQAVQRVPRATTRASGSA